MSLRGSFMEKSNDAIINTDVLKTVSEWSKSGMKTAIATVIETWGSSPRPAGSQLGVNERCEMIGSVSGLSLIHISEPTRRM